MWTKLSYDAIYDWPNAARRLAVRGILERDGLHAIVTRLEAAKNLGEWYSVTGEAADAVGRGVVAASARQAEGQLNRIAAMSHHTDGLSEAATADLAARIERAIQ